MKVLLFVQNGTEQPARALDVDRWWLVECKNTKDGIATIVMGDDGGPYGCRIVASGGK